MYKENYVITIILAAGTGTRFGGPVPKQFISLGKRTVLEESVSAFCERETVDAVIVAAPKETEDEVRKSLDSFAKVRSVACGGSTRQESMMNALSEGAKLYGDDAIVLIHDAARPFVSGELIDRVIEAAYEVGAALPAVKISDTVREVNDSHTELLDREKLFAAQTPQGFRMNVIKAAAQKAEKDGFIATDDAGLVEHMQHPVKIVEGDLRNKKITYSSDLLEAPAPARFGTGFDAHQLVSGRKLILCGVEIPYEKGLLGHSDADVATHALMDAILGAAALGDIGKLFPDTDDRYLGISSMALLSEVRKRAEDLGKRIGNVDVTIIAQAPKMAPYVDEMRKSLAEALGIDIDCVSVKATTTEKLGITGEGKGIAAEAIASIY